MVRACLCLLSVCLLSACADTIPCDCLIVAVRARAELPPATWSRLLLVYYPDRPIGHAYLVYALPGGLLGCYDGGHGNRIIRVSSRKTADVMAAVDPLAISAQYVEDLVH